MVMMKFYSFVAAACLGSTLSNKIAILLQLTGSISLAATSFTGRRSIRVA